MNEVRLAGGSFSWWHLQRPVTQAALPAFYAWGVTVAPVGWAHGASWFTVAAASLGLVGIVLAPLLERRSPRAARLTLGSTVPLSAILTLSFAPEEALTYFDAIRGLAGMLGWALFAFAIASPARPSSAGSARASPLETPLEKLRSDAPLLWLSLALATVLEIPGWRLDEPSRSVLIRVVALAGGLGVLTAAGAIVVAQHRLASEGKGRRVRRLRATPAGWLALAFLLLGGGSAYEVWGP